MRLETKIILEVYGILQHYGASVSLTQGNIFFDVDIGAALEEVPSKDRPEAEQKIMGMLWSFDITADALPALPGEELKTHSR